MDVLEAGLRGTTAITVKHGLSDVADNGKDEEFVHKGEPDVEPAGAGPCTSLEDERLRLFGGECSVNGFPEGFEAVTSEHSDIDGGTFGESLHMRDVVRLFDDRDEQMVAVEDHESIREAVDKRLLAVFNLGDGEGPVCDGLEKGVYGEGEFCKLVVAFPVKTGTVGLAAVFACTANAFGHTREGIEQEPALEPEDGQHEGDADQGNEQGQAPNRDPGYIRKGFGEGDGDHRNGVARDVTDGVDGLEGIFAEFPESAGVEVQRLGDERDDTVGGGL